MRGIKNGKTYEKSGVGRLASEISGYVTLVCKLVYFRKILKLVLENKIYNQYQLQN